MELVSDQITEEIYGQTVVSTDLDQCVVETQEIPAYFLEEGCEPNVVNNEILENVEKPVENSTFEGKDFQCKFCSKLFSSKFNLLTHVKTIHYNEKESFECEICQRKMSSMTSLKNHIKNIHEKSFPCSDCGLVFKSKHFVDKHNLEVHVKKSAYAMKCQILKPS